MEARRTLRSMTVPPQPFDLDFFGDIQRIASAKASSTPSNVPRRLRELENEGLCWEVRYVRGFAHYRAQFPSVVKAIPIAAPASAAATSA